MNIEELKIQDECAKASVGIGAGFDASVRARENLWFVQHETELIEAARVRQAPERTLTGPACCKTGDHDAASCCGK